MEMLSRMQILALVLLSASAATSSLHCKWMEIKFEQYSKMSFQLLDTMASDSQKEMDEEVHFPHTLFSQAANASAEDRFRFSAQVLDQVADLFTKNQSEASWDEKVTDDLVNVLTQQVEGLRSCIKSQSTNKKLKMYFKRLSHQVLQKMGWGADAWELIRKEVKTLLFRAERLIQSNNPPAVMQ